MTRVRFWLVAVVLLALGVPTLLVRAQDDPSDAPRRTPVDVPQASSTQPQAVQPQVAPAATGIKTLMPLARTGPIVGLQFSSAANDQCTPFTPGTSFPDGIKYLCYRFTVAGGKDAKYRTEWTLDGRAQTGLNESGTIFSDPRTIGGVICYGPYGLSCGSALPRGNWLVKFFLNEQLYSQVTVRIG